MAKPKKRSKTTTKRTTKTVETVTIRVMNPGLPDADEPPGAAPRVANPSVRFIGVPVDTNGNGDLDLVVIARGTGRDDAIREVAHHVDPDAWIDVGLARNHETKKAALAHGRRLAPHVEMLAARLARGES